MYERVKNLNDVSEGYSLFCCNRHLSLSMIEKSVGSKFATHVKSLKILEISRKNKNPASFETGFIVSTVVDDVVHRTHINPNPLSPPA